MKFTVAWADTLNQNQILKFVIGVLTACLLIFSITVSKLATQKPLLIERGCFSSVPTTVDPKRTPAEIESFIKVALPLRFDTQVNEDTATFVSPSEFTFRSREQTELSKKGISQRVLVNSIKNDAGDFLVEADRILAVGKLKSILPFPLRVQIATIKRTANNPYGLVLQKLTPAPVSGLEK